MKAMPSLLIASVLLLVPVTAYASGNLSAGLTHCWSFDNQHLAGSNPLDLVGTADGTNFGAVPGQPVTIAEGFGFGGGALVDFGVVDFSNLSFTVSLWVKTPMAFGALFLMWGDSDAEAGWGLAVSNPAAVSAFVLPQIAGSTYVAVTSGTIFDQGVARMITMAFDDAAKTLSLYVDGVLVGTSTNPLLGNITNPNAKLIMGRHAFKNQEFFTGYVDETSVWARVLAPQEILDLYNDGAGVSCADLANSVLVVGIDIKPGSLPNSINLGSPGVVPVAILGSPTFDALQVDPATVTLAGARVKRIGKANRPSCAPSDVNGDGLPDLVCHVMTAEMLIIGPGDSVAVLQATTFSGQEIRGEDSVRVVPE